jgi:hypothetical protein
MMIKHGRGRNKSAKVLNESTKVLNFESLSAFGVFPVISYVLLLRRCSKKSETCGHLNNSKHRRCSNPEKLNAFALTFVSPFVRE